MIVGLNDRVENLLASLMEENEAENSPSTLYINDCALEKVPFTNAKERTHLFQVLKLNDVSLD